MKADKADLHKYKKITVCHQAWCLSGAAHYNETYFPFSETLYYFIASELFKEKLL